MHWVLDIWVGGVLTVWSEIHCFLCKTSIYTSDIPLFLPRALKSGKKNLSFCLENCQRIILKGQYVEVGGGEMFSNLEVIISQCMKWSRVVHGASAVSCLAFSGIFPQPRSNNISLLENLYHCVRSRSEPECLRRTRTHQSMGCSSHISVGIFWHHIFEYQLSILENKTKFRQKTVYFFPL